LKEIYVNSLFAFQTSATPTFAVQWMTSLLILSWSQAGARTSTWTLRCHMSPCAQKKGVCPKVYG